MKVCFRRKEGKIEASGRCIDARYDLLTQPVNIDKQRCAKSGKTKSRRSFETKIENLGKQRAKH